MSEQATPRWVQGDRITRITMQVRGPGGRVHNREEESYDPEHGYCYLTSCGRKFFSVNGAALTTYPADCRRCRERQQ